MLLYKAYMPVAQTLHLQEQRHCPLSGAHLLGNIMQSTGAEQVRLSWTTHLFHDLAQFLLLRTPPI